VTVTLIVFVLMMFNMSGRQIHHWAIVDFVPTHVQMSPFLLAVLKSYIQLPPMKFVLLLFHRVSS